MSSLSANGYVHNLVDQNQTFEEFMISCAKGFGAVIMMRDMDGDEEITIKNISESSDYHLNEIAQAEKELTRLQNMSSEERALYGETTRQKEIESINECMATRRAELDICKNTLSKVKSWTPPTDDHISYKDTIVKWMEETLKNEEMGPDSYYEKERKLLQKSSPMSIYQRDVQQIKEDIVYHDEALAKEKARNAERISWTSALFKSLGKELK